MTVWESGRESTVLDYIISGDKTIEGRLCRGKFANYRPGDVVWLRRDQRDDSGVLQDGDPRQVLVEVVGIRHYRTFFAMVTTEDFKKVIPYANSPEQAAFEYGKYYSVDEQAKYGVLAIEFKVLSLREAMAAR